MVLCPDRQAFVRRIQTRPFCDGPAQQDAIEFQPKVIVKTGGGVLLDQVREFVGACCYPSGRRFGESLAPMLHLPCSIVPTHRSIKTLPRPEGENLRGKSHAVIACESSFARGSNQ